MSNRNRRVAVRRDDKGYFLKLKEGVFRYASVRIRTFDEGDHLNCKVYVLGDDDPNVRGRYTAQCQDRSWDWCGNFQREEESSE